MQAVASENLQFGSLIFLTFSDDFYMHSQGFVDTSVHLKKVQEVLNTDCLGAVFRVLPQCMYTVQSDVIRLCNDNQRDKALRLEESLGGEMKTNIQTYAHFKGQTIKFGSLIQLEHVQSQKFLTLHPDKNSEGERDHLKISLEDFANEHSLFRIEPSFRYQREGNRTVHFGDQIFLEVTVTTFSKPAYLHASATSNSQHPFYKLRELINEGNASSRAEDEVVEVNASLDSKKKWRVVKYANYSPDVDSLNCGDYVWLTHSESDVCLVAKGETQDIQIEFNENIKDTNGLWRIERERNFLGGQVNLDEQFRLKHLSTGLYLSVEVDQSIKSLSRLSFIIAMQIKKKATHRVVLKEANDPNTLWRFEVIPGRHKSAFVQKDEFYKLINISTSFALYGVDDSGFVQPCLSNQQSEITYFKLSRCDERTVWETLFLLNCLPILNHFPSFIEKQRTQSVRTRALQDRYFTRSIALMKKCLSDLDLFCKNKLQNMLALDKQYGEVQGQRQNILREQHFLDSLAYVLKSSFSQDDSQKLLVLNRRPKLRMASHQPTIPEIIFEFSAENQSVSKDFEKNFLEQELREIVEVAEATYNLIKTACLKNEANQAYCFQFFPIFKTHAGFDLGASACITAILNQNEKLLMLLHKTETTSDLLYDNENLISHYARLLKIYYRERKPQLLQFLRAVCTHNDEGITVNQEKVHEQLFESPHVHSRAVISTAIDSKKLYLLLPSNQSIGEERVLLDSCYSEGQLIMYHGELTYFAALLELFADICLGRNHVSTESIKKWLPLETITNYMWNKDLSIEIRAAFCRLLLHVYLDSYPRQIHKKPELCRVIGAVQHISNLEDFRNSHRLIFNDQHLEEGHESISKRAYSLGLEHFFTSDVSSEPAIFKEIRGEEEHIAELKEDLLQYMDEHKETDDFDILTYEIVRTANKLAAFSVFGAVCTDFPSRRIYVDPSTPDFNYKNLDIVRLVKGLMPFLLHGRRLPSKILSKSTGLSLGNDTRNTSSADLVKDLGKKKKAAKRFFESGANYLNQVMNDPNAMSDSIVRGAITLKNFLSSMTYTQSSDNDDNWKVLTKLEICNLLQFIMDWRLDYLISNSVTWFDKKKHKPEALRNKFAQLLPKLIKAGDEGRLKKRDSQKKFNKIFTDKFRRHVEPEIPDLQNCIEDPDLVPMLLKTLSNSENYELQTALVMLIGRLFSQRKEFMRALDQMHVLTSTNDVKLYTWIKFNLDTIKQNMEQSEVWLKYWLASKDSYDYEERLAANIEKFETVQRIILSLEAILHKESTIHEEKPVVGDSSEISEDRQSVLYFLDVHVLIISLIKDGIHSLAEIYGQDFEPRDRLVKLFASCFRLLKKFTAQNSRNQEALYLSMHIFTANLEIDVCQVELICEIYKDNYSLCNRLKIQDLEPFVNLILKKGRQARFLQIFKVVQVVKDKGVPEMQRAVLNLFTTTNMKRLLFMDDSQNLLFTFEAEANEATFYRDEPFEYHAHLLEVLKLSSFGNINVYLNEAKCQKLVPLQEIFKLLILAEEGYFQYAQLKVPLLEFMLHVYFDREKDSEEITGNSDLMAYINIQSKRLYEVEELSVSDLPFIEVWLRILKVYGTHYLKSSGAISDRDDTKAIKLHCLAFTNNLAKLIRLEMPEHLIELIRDFCSTYGRPLPPDVIQNFKWIIDEPNTPIKTSLAPQAKLTWQLFIQEMLFDKKLEGLLQEEKTALFYALKYVEKLSEGDVPFSILVTKLVTYLSFVPSRKPPLQSTLYVVEFLKLIILGPKSKASLTQKQQEKLQNQLMSMGLARVVLGLMCDSSINYQLFTALLALSVALLEGGNLNIQNEFYQYFVTFRRSEQLFKRLHEILNSYIESLADHYDKEVKDPIYVDKKQGIREALRFLHLLCENHNSKLQKYLLLQESSRNNYNMVSLTVNLLGELLSRMKLKSFHIISQCFDTLTEFIQGPCFANQNAVIDSKFLEYANTLMFYDESADSISRFEVITADLVKKDSVVSENANSLKGWMIAHCKYKCMITTFSLLEGRDDNYVITRMIRAFSMEVLKANLIGIYDNYCRQYKAGYYERKLFNHFEENIHYDFNSTKNPQDTNPRHFSLIIETGFLIFHMMRAFYDNEDPENRRIIEYELPELVNEETETKFVGAELLSDLSKLGAGFFKSALSKLKRNRNASHPETITSKRSLEEAYQFFSSHTGSVEVIFSNDCLNKVYFSLPSFASHLAPEMKDRFHLNVDRSSDKKKLQYLVDSAPTLIEEMKHEHKLNKLLSKNFCISLIAKHVRLWRELAWIITLILNFLILASYSTYGTDRILEPSLFYSESEDGTGLDTLQTKNLFFLLGTIQCVCAGMVVLFFLMKSGPVLAKRGWIAHKPKGNRRNSCLNAVQSMKQLVWTIAYVLSNFETLYYSCYVLVSILGTVTHPFYFAFHLLDILQRYPSLQNVVRSITKPRKSLILTFLLMIVLIYLFSIWGYSIFSKYFYGNCPSLAICLMTTFYEGLKNGGGIGEYLEPWTTGRADSARFLYDNLFNIVIMIIMLNIVQGIIIDTFAVLREEQERNNSDIELKCFICGLAKEEIERGSTTSFALHKYYEHNEWNYLHFIAYLSAKEDTELTGVESYIQNKLNKGEIDWFPMYRALRVKLGDLTENAKLFELVSQLSQRLEALERRLP